MIGYHLWESSCICKCCGKRRDKGHNFRTCTCQLCGRERHNWEEIKSESCRKSTEYERHGSYYNAEGGHDEWTEVTVTKKCTECGEERTNSHNENYERHSY